MSEPPSSDSESRLSDDSTRSWASSIADGLVASGIDPATYRDIIELPDSELYDQAEDIITQKFRTRTHQQGILTYKLDELCMAMLDESISNTAKRYAAVCIVAGNAEWKKGKKAITWVPVAWIENMF